MRRHIGVLHVHSTFSDGELNLEQIAALARAQGLHFVLVADHAPYVPGEQVEALVERCAALSSEGLLMVPGLEFELEGRHVVAIGPGELLSELYPDVVVREPQEVRRRGGFTIWAHPAVTFDWCLKRAMRLDYDAWEIWNKRAEGERPSLPLQVALRKAERRGQTILALAGADFHKGEAISGPFVTIEGPEKLSLQALLKALRQGLCEIRLPDKAPGMRPKMTSVMRYVARRVCCILALAKHRLLTASPRD